MKLVENQINREEYVFRSPSKNKFSENLNIEKAEDLNNEKRILNKPKLKNSDDYKDKIDANQKTNVIFSYLISDKQIKLSLDPLIVNEIHQIISVDSKIKYEFTYWNFLTSINFFICKKSSKATFFEIEEKKISKILSFNSFTMIMLKLYHDLLSVRHE